MLPKIFRKKKFYFVDNFFIFLYYHIDFLFIFAPVTLYLSEPLDNRSLENWDVMSRVRFKPPVILKMAVQSYKKNCLKAVSLYQKVEVNKGSR